MKFSIWTIMGAQLFLFFISLWLKRMKKLKVLHIRIILEATSSFLHLCAILFSITKKFSLWSVISVFIILFFSYAITLMVSRSPDNIKSLAIWVLSDILFLLFIWRLGISISRFPWYYYIIIFFISLLMSALHNKKSNDISQ